MFNKKLFYALCFLFSVMAGACAQNIAPKQIMPATILRVPNPAKQYALVFVPSDGGRFWYKDIDSLKGNPQYSAPNWQQVTNVGKVTSHFVTAAGLTLTQLTSGADVDSFIVVKDGALKRAPRVTPIQHSMFTITNSETTPTYSLVENPVQYGSNVGAIPLVNTSLTVFSERWRDSRIAGFREIVKDSQAVTLPLAPTNKMTFDIMIQSNIRKLQFIGSAAYPIDTMTQRQFQNVRHGSVFRCQLINHNIDGVRWLIWQASNPEQRPDTLELSENRVVQLSEYNKQVFLSSRSGTWTSNNGIEFKLPKFPSNGQEIVISNQILIPGNTEFKFTATGGYTLGFSPSEKIFAFDPLGVNTTAQVVFTNLEFQFRCSANTIHKRWSCFVISQ